MNLPYGDYGTSPTTLNGRDVCPICGGSGGGYESNEGVEFWVECICARVDHVECAVCMDTGEVRDGADGVRPCARCAHEFQEDRQDDQDG